MDGCSAVNGWEGWMGLGMDAIRWGEVQSKIAKIVPKIGKYSLNSLNSLLTIMVTIWTFN